MFLYGNMLKEGDKVPYRVDGVDRTLKVMDIWESRMPRETPHGTFTGARWVELWGWKQGERTLIAIKRFGDFDPVYGVERDTTQEVQVGVARKPYASSVSTTHSYREWISTE